MCRGPICACSSENQSVMNIILKIKQLCADVKWHARPVKQWILLLWPTTHSWFDWTWREICNWVLCLNHRILVGAPRGRFPGGLDSDFPANFYAPNASACMNPDVVANVSSFNESQVREECYMRSGLIYNCSLNSTKCAAPVGNGNPDSPDEFLFKRTG